MLTERDDIVALDSAIIQHPRVWEASGHVAGFSDPMVDCKTCKKRFREDKLDIGECGKKPSKLPGEGPDCELTEARQFNLMFKTQVGPVAESGSEAYLRPETAQGIFINFKNVLQFARKKPPFGIAQIGKSFRNEITTGNFIFRTREFEQMEMEFFCPPDEAEKWHEHWMDERMRWYTDLGIRPDNLILRAHEADELSHYSSATSDIEYLLPDGLLRARGDRQPRRLRPHPARRVQRREARVLRPAERRALRPPRDRARRRRRPRDAGLPRRRLLGRGGRGPPAHRAVACTRSWRRSRSRSCRWSTRTGWTERAREIFESLRRRIGAEYDDGGSIGKRYRRQDEIGTPWCVTIDGETAGDDSVTLRDRDSLEQERVPIEGLPELLLERLEADWTSPNR